MLLAGYCWWNAGALNVGMDLLGVVEPHPALPVVDASDLLLKAGTHSPPPGMQGQTHGLRDFRLRMHSTTPRNQDQPLSIPAQIPEPRETPP